MATIYNPEDKDKNKEAPVSATGQPLQTIGTATPQPTSGMQTAEKRPQGSGRFTNLQKYLQANQGAGQKIAGQVGKDVQKGIGTEEKQAQDYYNQLGKSVSEAQKTADMGAKFKGQLGQMGEAIGGQTLEEGATYQDYQARQAKPDALSSIQQFTQDPSYRDFQNIQAGRAIDENLLGMRQAQAAREAGQYLDEAQRAQQALGSEGGRFDLLRKSFGGASRPGYTTGQQRLDQALLSQGGLGGLRGGVTEQVNKARALAGLAGQGAGEVSRLATQERGLIGDINKQATANEQAYMDMLKSYVDPVQQQRETEWDALNKSMEGYTGPTQYNWTPTSSTAGMLGQSGYIKSANPNYTGLKQGLTGEQMKRLGLTGQEGTYNVFKNISDASEMAKKGAAARSAQDVATEKDVDRYRALADILGMDPEASNIKQASTIGESYGKRGDEFDLVNRLDRAEDQFQKDFAKQNILKQGSFLFNDDHFARGAAQATIDDMLKRGTGAITQGGTGVYSNYASQRAANEVWNEFMRMMDQQNYHRTIGGQRSSALMPDGGVSVGPGSAEGLPDKLRPEDLETPIVDPNDTGKLG